MSAPRAALDRLTAYEPGKPHDVLRRERGLTGPLVALANNEGPFGPVPAALEAIERAAATANRYPDAGSWALRDALSSIHGLPFGQVVAGPGVDGILMYLSLALLEPGDEIACCWPTFPVYLADALKLGAVPVTVPCAGAAYDLEALAAAITPRTRIVYVTNPNNPTGGIVGRAALATFLDDLPEHVLPVIDEAYWEYVDDPDYPDALAEHFLAGRRVAVLRTFSKIYGLAGLRVGWAALPQDIAEACIKVKNAFDVSQVAQAAALASLEAGDEVAQRREQAARGRALVTAGLEALGCRPLPSAANFVYAELDDAGGVTERLEARGVLVRHAIAFGAPHAIRVTVGTDEEIDAFLHALEHALRL